MKATNTILNLKSNEWKRCIQHGRFASGSLRRQHRSVQVYEVVSTKKHHAMMPIRTAYPHDASIQIEIRIIWITQIPGYGFDISLLYIYVKSFFIIKEDNLL